MSAFRDEADQARYVVDRVLEYRESGVLLKQQAVLFRASHHSGPLEIAQILRPAQKRKDIFNMWGLEKLKAAEFHQWDIASRQSGA